jgi:hypothetical protein
MRGQRRLAEGRARSKSVMAWVEPSVSTAVDDLAARKGVTRSWLLRRALAEYIERERSS